MGTTDRARNDLAAAVREYVQQVPPRSSAAPELGAALCRLLQEALSKTEGWDGFMWLDGLVPRELSIHEGELTIVGGIYVMNGQQTFGVWPVQATIRADGVGAAGLSVGILFGDRNPRPTPTNKEGRFDVYRLQLPAHVEQWRFSLRL